ncbi:MAG: sulfur carrier protein ThiS [Chloracidobacterium sp.]|nr:sulfur carrier protein ThiS [Chloracidobacterium sp.]MCO5334392.1 sulfur carrier protein ThiS [Pyrinomonadaceae bacterium]
MRRIILNGEKKEITAEIGRGITDLVQELGLSARRIAVELNGSVIRRADWDITPVNDGDKIEIVHFVGGG